MIHVALLGDQWGKTIKPSSLKGEPGMNLGCPWKVEARLGLISVADTEEESISKTQFNPQKMKCFPIGLEEVTGSLEDPAQYLLCQHIYFPLMAISPRKACLLFGKWAPRGEKLTAQVPAKNEKGPWFQCHHPGAMFKCLLLKNYSSIEEKVSPFEGLQRTKETYGWSCWKVDFGLGSRGPPPRTCQRPPCCCMWHSEFSTQEKLQRQWVISFRIRVKGSFIRIESTPGKNIWTWSLSFLWSKWPKDRDANTPSIHFFSPLK